MAVIQVTPEMLKGKAGEMRTIKEQHDESMAKMKSLISGLNEIWKGEALDALVAKYNSMQSTFTNFSEMLGEYAQLMDTAANKLQETDQNLSNTMKSFGE